MSNDHWQKDIRELYSAETLRNRVREMGQQISRDYAGRQLCVVGVLKGSFIFFADLVRHIDLPLSCDFIGISSYGDDTETSGVVQITSDLSKSIEGLDVLLVEDIVDTGLSMKYLLDNFRIRKARSVKVCTLLEKPDNARVQVPIEYTGFKIPNEFVIGYGLDYAGRYRNLPYIGVYAGKIE